MIVDISLFLGLVLTSVMFIYVAPAIAFFPRWASDSDFIFAVPILSIGIVYGIARLFLLLGVWSPEIVQITLAGIFLVALGRSRSWIVEFRNTERKVDWRIIAVVGVLLLPVLAELAAAPFDSDDENTSWNYWAKLAFLGNAPDLFYTRAPYPQLFTFILATNYALLGDWSYQLVIKAALWMIPLSCFGLLATFVIKRFGRSAALIVLLIVVYFVDLRGEFRVAYADPLMSTFLLAGFYFLYREGPKTSNWQDLCLASVFFSLCGLTKQAGLPWAMLFFPILYAISQERRLRHPRYWWPMITPILVGGIWLLTEGNGVLANRGVIQASLGDRDLIQQLTLAIKTYGKRPELVITYLTFFIAACWKPSWRKCVVAVSLAISTGLWLIFGGYQYRLGIHNFLIAWFFIILFVSEDTLIRSGGSKSRTLDRVFIVSVCMLLIASLIYSGLTINKRLRGTGSISLLDGLGRQAWSFLGYEGEAWITELQASGDTRVLVFSNYLNGMLSPEFKVLRMEGLHSTDNPETLAEYIENEGVTHFITIGNPLYRWGAGNLGLLTLASSCPQKYVTVSEAKGNQIGLFIDFQATLYRVSAFSCEK